MHAQIIRKTVVAAVLVVNNTLLWWQYNIIYKLLGDYYQNSYLLLVKLQMCFISTTKFQLECGPMSNMMVALPNTGSALYSTPQSLADAHYLTAMQ